MNLLASLGFMFSILGIIFAMGALKRVSKLEKELKETEVLKKEYKST